MRFLKNLESIVLDSWGGLTKFGVAKNLRNRLSSREYKTSIIDDYRTWSVSEEIMFEKETEIREQFKDRLRERVKNVLGV